MGKLKPVVGQLKEKEADAEVDAAFRREYVSKIYKAKKKAGRPKKIVMDSSSSESEKEKSKNKSRINKKFLPEDIVSVKKNINWRVILNNKLWDQKLYENDWIKNKEIRKIAQSKGNCKMVNCPVLNDTVDFVINGKIAMKGIIETDGFIIGNEHQKYSKYNIGENRIHTETMEYVWVIIIKIGLSEDIRNTGRRTWVKYNCNKYDSDDEKEIKNKEIVLKPENLKNVIELSPNNDGISRIIAGFKLPKPLIPWMEYFEKHELDKEDDWRHYEGYQLLV
jgi:hypothetical protein